MGLVIYRLIVIGMCAALAWWGVDSARHNIKTGVIWAFRGTRFRDQSPFDFWGYIVLKILGAIAAAIFALAYLYLGLTT